jgi:hypothetical protein
MELCENQIFILLTCVGLVIGVIGVLAGIVAVILQYQKNKREKQVQAPLLIPYRFGKTSLQAFFFRFKNYGQTKAKSIDITCEIENLGEVILPKDGFKRTKYKTTLAPQDYDAVTFNWTSEIPLTDKYISYCYKKRGI